MPVHTVNFEMREETTRYRGLFGTELHQYALLVCAANDRFIVRLGDDHINGLHAFTYRSQAVKFLEDQNAVAKAEVARILALREAKEAEAGASGS